MQQLQKFVPVVFDTEGVGQGEGYRRIAGVRQFDGLAHGRLGFGLLPQVALEVHNLYRREVAVVEVVGSELARPPRGGWPWSVRHRR